MAIKTKKTRPGLAGRKPPRHEVADSLRGRMAAGELKVGDRMPSLASLVARYGVAQNTAKAAIDLLRAEGLETTAWPGYGLVIEKLPHNRAA